MPDSELHQQGVFIWYCPNDLGIGQDAAAPAAEQDNVSGVLCYVTEQACETSPSNICGSGSSTSCTYGATTGCAFTSEAFNWYCPLSTALNGSQLLVAQVDPTSQLTCYASIASCHLTASTQCSGANGGVPCINGQANYCAYTGPTFNYFCPLSTGGLPSSVAGALTSIYEIDGITGVACFSTQARFESTASTTCGPTINGYSGVSCAVGATSVCAYVSSTSEFSFYCPNMLGVAHSNVDVVQIDPVSLLPCYTTAQSCSFALSNLCTYVPKGRLANSSSVTTAAVCVDGSSTGVVLLHPFLASRGLTRPRQRATQCAPSRQVNLCTTARHLSTGSCPCSHSATQYPASRATTRCVQSCGAGGVVYTELLQVLTPAPLVMAGCKLRARSGQRVRRARRRGCVVQERRL